VLNGPAAGVRHWADSPEGGPHGVDFLGVITLLFRNGPARAGAPLGAAAAVLFVQGSFLNSGYPAPPTGRIRDTSSMIRLLRLPEIIYDYWREDIWLTNVSSAPPLQ
jgi:hypothetical protein